MEGLGIAAVSCQPVVDVILSLGYAKILRNFWILFF